MFKNKIIITFVLLFGLKIYAQKNYGKLSEVEFKELKKSLSPTNTFENNLTIIIYYPGRDRCNQTKEKVGWNVFDRDYEKKLSKINSYQHFWIYKEYGDLKYYYPKKVYWQSDKDNMVEKLFFKTHYPCFSNVVIDQFGNYITRFGEFGKTTVWENSKELTNKKYAK